MAESLKGEINLEACGWTRRFTSCEPGLSEAVELYRESGFEVLLVKLKSEKAGINCKKNDEKYECLKCFDGTEKKYRIIYTRPKKRTT